MKSLFLSWAVILFLGIGLVSIAPAAYASADTKSEICEGVNVVSGGSGCNDSTGRLQNILGTAINLLSIFVGIAATIMVIVGGFKYVTSGGDTGKLKSARDTIIYAIIGLVIVALAQTLVKFVLNRLA